MSRNLSLSILEELIPAGVGYGKLLLVEFDADSIWYEASLTIAANALRDGIRTDYHTFQRPPSEITGAVTRLGVDAKKLEEQNILRIIDSYTEQTGIGAGERARKSAHDAAKALKLSLEWSVDASKLIKGVPDEAEKRRLHIDDNTSVLNRYNKENEIIDFWRTRTIPVSRKLEVATVNSLLTGVYSEAFYRQFESLSDGIIDFKTTDREGQIEHRVRVRTMRGTNYDSRWRTLRLLESGEVALTDH